MLALLAAGLMAASPANSNCVPLTYWEQAQYAWAAQVVALAGQCCAQAPIVGRGEIVICGRQYSYEYRGPGVYWLRRGSGSKREFYATVPGEAEGDIWIARAGSLSMLTLMVRGGRLEIKR